MATSGAFIKGAERHVSAEVQTHFLQVQEPVTLQTLHITETN